MSSNDPLRWRFEGTAVSEQWQLWLNSDEGKRMSSGAAIGTYLENRLERAFQAGMEAALKLADEHKG